MTTREDVIAVAKLFAGYHESENKLNIFGRWYGMNGCAWCGMFVSACYAWAGRPLSLESDKGYAYCPAAVDLLKQRSQWSDDNPEPGDIVFFNWDGGDQAEHTGIVLRVNGDGLYTIEGNTSDEDWSDGGTVALKLRHRALILGYGKVTFDNKPIGKLAVDAPPPPEKVIGLSTPHYQGQEVSLWLQQMVKRGWAAPVKPVFDEKVRDLVQKFQQELGIEADGILGPETWLLTWVEPFG